MTHDPKVGKLYREGMKVIVRHDAKYAPEYTKGKVGTIVKVTSIHVPCLESYDSAGYKICVKIANIEFPLLSNDVEPIADHQNRIKSIKHRFLNHLKNSREVNITEDGILSVNFINKKVDVCLFADISTHILKPLYKKRFNAVIAPETSSFYTAPIIALALNADFIPIRRGPYVPKTWGGYISSRTKIVSATKNVEEHFLIPVNTVEPGDKILLFDDFIRSGNAMLGGISAISESEGEVDEILTIIDIGYHDGRKKLEREGYTVRSLMSVHDFEILDNKKARLHIEELFFEKFDPKKKLIDVALKKENR